MNNIILIGPKKTGTTSVYEALKAAGGGYNLLPKESNCFIKKKQDYLYSIRQPFVDVSPEYYTSFRALIKISEFVELYPNTKIIVLLRDYESRNYSHFSYMVKKGEIGQDLSQEEVECLMLSNIKIWENYYNNKIIFLTVDDCFSYLSAQVNKRLIVVKSNQSNFEVRYGFLYKLASRLSRMLRMSNRLAVFVEKISPLASQLLYKKVDKDQSLTQNDLYLRIKKIVDDIVTS